MEDFKSKLVWFFVGVLAKYLVKGSIWDLAPYQRWKANRQTRLEEKELTSALAANGLILRLGNLEVHQMIVQPFFPGLTIGEVPCVWGEQQRNLPPDVEQLEFSYLPRKIADLQKRGRTADLNDGYDLRRVRFMRPQVHGGARSNRPELTFGPSNYKYYLMLNESLDENILVEANGDPTTMRRRYNITFDTFDWSQVESLPVHAYGGTVCAVITADNQMVIGLRSNLQAVRDRSRDGDDWRADTSCAEGMLRPRDSHVNSSSVPTPFLTAFRALEDELGLLKGVHYVEEDVKMIALAFDEQRCQPVFVFMLQLSQVPFSEVYECWQFANDREERAAILPISATPQSLAELLLNQRVHEGKTIRLFSNHQQLGVLLPAMASCGTGQMRRALANSALQRTGRKAPRR